MISGKTPSMMTPVEGDALIALIPQKPPFVLISRLTNVTEQHCSTSFTIAPDHVLCHNGKLTYAGVIENIAQSCAAKVGYEYSLRGKSFPIGFIGDIKDFSFTRLPAVGEEIETEIEIINRIFEVTIISGKVKLNGEEIAHGVMKIYAEPEKD